MPLTFIEVSDYYLTVRQGDTQHQQLGCCLVQPDDVLFGQLAWQQKLLNPQQSYSQYWQQLSYEKIYCDNTDVEHFADLAYLQLKTILSQFEQLNEATLLVSASYSSEQLALLVGIVEACGFSQVRLLNHAAVQAASFYSVTSSLPATINEIYLVDMRLHQLMVSEISINSGVSLAQFQCFHKKGLVDLVAYLSSWINELYIQEYRYDTFDCAETEQNLHNQINTILASPQANYQIRMNGTENLNTNAQIVNERPIVDTLATNEIIDKSAKHGNLFANASANSSEKLLVISHSQLQQQLQHFFKDVIAEIDNTKLFFLTGALATLIANIPSLAHWQEIPESIVYPFITDYVKQHPDPVKLELIKHFVVEKSTAGHSTPCETTITEKQASHLLYQGRICCLEHGMELRTNRDQQPFAQLLKKQHHWSIKLLGQASVYVNDKLIVNGQSLVFGDTIFCSYSSEKYTLVTLTGSDDFYGF
jgi:hypothetical protein